MDDEKFIRAAIHIAWQSRENGNHPFGAVLVDKNGRILLEAENTVVTEKDCTGHAETNLIRKASQKYSREFLAGCSLYTSTEPCPMCSGAIFWGNVRRVVFGLAAKQLYALVGENEESLSIACRDLFEKGSKPIEVIGPVLADEAMTVHEGFWA